VKKILNDPANYVDEALAGMAAAHPRHYRLTGDEGRVIARAGEAAACGGDRRSRTG
jgi:dihydroxyacetone kinase